MAINNLLTKFRGRNDVPVHRGELDPFRGFQGEMNRLFDDFFEGFSMMPSLYGAEGQSAMFSPGVDLSETDKDVVITVELPGMDKNDVSVEMDDEAITISGEKKEEREDKNRNWHFREQSYGKFRRVLPLPAAVNGDKAKASFKKGLLTVTVPKKEEAKVNRKTIDISTD